MWIVKKNKIKRTLLYIVVCLFVFSGLIYGFLFEIGYIPYSREVFLNYDNFRNKANDFFLDGSPKSAENFKYFWYRGYFDEVKAVSFDVNKMDYEKIRDYYKMEFGENGKWGNNWSVNRNDEMVTNDFIKRENLDFLLEVSSREINEYKMIEYRASSTASNSRNMLGIMVSESREDKYNMVLFYCKDSFPD